MTTRAGRALVLFVFLSSSLMSTAEDKDVDNKENTNPETPAPKKGKKPNKTKSKKSETKTDTAETKPRAQRVVFSEDDDKIMIQTLLDQKNEGMATDNGGWKEPALQAVVRALAGSELESGGVPKNIRNVRDHWGKVYIS